MSTSEVAAHAAQPDPGDTAIELVCKYRVTHLTQEEAAAARAAAPHAPGSHEEEIAAARAFDAVEAAASGVPLEPEGGAAGPSPRSAGGPAAAADGSQGARHSAARPFFARLLENRRLTAPDHFQDVRHLVIDLAGSGISYLPGDVLAIVPRQPAAAVAAVMQVGTLCVRHIRPACRGSLPAKHGMLTCDAPALCPCSATAFRATPGCG